MVTEILLFVFIAVLLGYIIFLHIQLAKKNIFIESTIRRLTGIEKNWNQEEMMTFLHEMKKNQYYSSFFTDKLFDEKPMEFLLENEKYSKIYIHYTKEENDARNILKEGFLFADSFYKTALPVTSDKLDLLIKHNSRKSFGKYLIIICLSDKIVERYSSELNNKGLKSFFVENVLTVAPPFRNENSDIVYQLSNKFVKGFINYQTGEITKNPDYDPLYDSPLFEKNLEMLKQNSLN